MKNSFAKFSGWYAILAAVFGLLYALSFIVLKNNLLSALFLMLGGLFATAPLVTLFERLRAGSPQFALWGFLFALAGTLGSVIHAGYDLANAINVPATLNTDLPSAVDPRGLSTFSLAGFGLLIFAWLILRYQPFPRGFAWLGLLSGFLMVVLYLGRLVVLNATSILIVVPALLEGFLVNPIWYLWLGLLLLRE
jgi:hypothetical protein